MFSVIFVTPAYGCIPYRTLIINEKISKKKQTILSLKKSGYFQTNRRELKISVEDDRISLSGTPCPIGTETRRGWVKVAPWHERWLFNEHDKHAAKSLLRAAGDRFVVEKNCFADLPDIEKVVNGMFWAPRLKVGNFGMFFGE